MPSSSTRLSILINIKDTQCKHVDFKLLPCHWNNLKKTLVLNPEILVSGGKGFPETQVVC